jgi:predicted anti-sigma-YlaC factor YlaD
MSSNDGVAEVNSEGGATQPPGLPCVEVVELATDYLEGTLPPPLLARVEAHLQICEPCQIYLEQMRQTIRVMGRLHEEEIAPEVRTALLSAYRELRTT